MNRRSENNFNRGFTLLELIVAMMMIALLAGTLYQNLNVAFNAKKAAERTIRPPRAAAVALDIMQRDFDAAIKPDPQSPLVTGQPLLDQYVLSLGFFAQGGDPAWVEFYTLGSDGTPNVPLSEGIRKIEYTVRNDIPGIPSALVRRITRNLTAPAEIEPEEEVICKNVVSFQARYFDGLDWYNEWDCVTQLDALGAPGLPMAVELTLTMSVQGVSQPGRAADTYTVRRVIPISCGTPVG